MQNPHGAFQLAGWIPAPTEAVYAYFSDPRHTQELQPFMRSVVVDKEEVAEGKRMIHFRSEEFVPMVGGLWKQKNAIEAQWHLTQPPYRMEATAYSKPDVHVHIHYTFAPTSEDNTYLTLDIQWRAPWIFRRLVPKKAAKAQQGVLDQLHNHFSKA